MKGRILVLGATGRLGSVAAETFRDAGWSVTGLIRPGTSERVPRDINLVEAHALNEEAVEQAAAQADVILHALNAPYKEWSSLVPRFADIAVEAARKSGATLIFPGNLYVYGPPLPEVIDESTPKTPSSRKGTVRLYVERRLREASQDGVRVVILRAGDFFGGSALGSWFDRVVVRNIAHKRITSPGPDDVIHEWAYLPDLAAAMVKVADARTTFPPFETFGFPGHSVTGREMTKALAQATHMNLRISSMPWWFLRTLAPVVPTFRELSELAYLWQQPHRISGAKLQQAIGEIPHTPFDQAVLGAMRSLGFDG
jgi:nucleoside-diphosphate-sugar epimerase